MADHIGGSWWLVARHGTEIAATWLVPVEFSPDGPVARRCVRALPYAAPRVTVTHPKKRREIWRALISYLQSECIGIELPLAPGVNDFGVFAELGAFLEARQTHCLYPPGLTLTTLTSKARNAIAAAAARTEIEVSNTARSFDFGSAIVAAPDWQVRIRRTLAEACVQHRSVLMVAAKRDDRPIGQILALHDGQYALMMHAWRDRGSGVRGVASLLIERLARHAFLETGLQVLDLEGSILAAVDHFMDGIGATPTPYAIVYWYRDRAVFMQQLEASLDIPGRQAVIET
jgi:Acetyltransferase (GNAT) domain